jgi:hypothetical protein
MVEDEFGHGFPLVSNRAAGAQLIACRIIITKLGQDGIIIGSKRWWRRINARPTMRKSEGGNGHGKWPCHAWCGFKAMHHAAPLHLWIGE